LQQAQDMPSLGRVLRSGTSQSSAAGPGLSGWNGQHLYGNQIIGSWGSQQRGRSRKSEGPPVPFNEDQKREVKEKAAFRCCRCQQIGIEVHHIIPEAVGGTDTLDNAAPVCPSCHASFGDNPQKRKEITQMRDWWYHQVEEMYCGPGSNLGLLPAIDAKLDDIRHNQGAELRDLKEMLRKVSNETIDGITPETATAASSLIVNASDATSSVRLGERVHANFVCRRCNSRIGLLIGTNACPNCGAPLG